jgi:hypothetical protein
VVLPFRPANTLMVLTTADLEIAAIVLDARASSPNQPRQLINEIAPRFADCEVTSERMRYAAVMPALVPRPLPQRAAPKTRTSTAIFTEFNRIQRAITLAIGHAGRCFGP